MKEIPISETVSLKSSGLNEAWLQDQIWNNPSCLGLGDLEGVTKERVVSSGGRLDILLKNPIDDSMYEVETMLGETDPDHIVRTIEYWDLIKRKWPQRQHYAVLVAERITKRFFNVIRILSDAVPLIAIQVNVIKSPHGELLHFTKILDVYEELDDETITETGVYNESYWTEKSSNVLTSAKFLLGRTSEIYDHPELKFNKNSIVISSCGYNQMLVKPRSGKNVLVVFRFGGKQDEIRLLLEDGDLQYTEQQGRFKIQLSPEMIVERAEMFSQIAELNTGWWVG